MQNSDSDEDKNENRIKDLQNYLSVAPLQMFNLKPDENGVVNVQL